MDADPRIIPVAASVYAAVGARDWAAAMAAVEAEWGLVRSVRPSLIQLVADALPAEELTRRPRWLAFRQTISLTSAEQLRPSRLLRMTGETAQTGADLDGVWLCVTHAATFRHVGRYAEARDFAQRGIEEARALVPGAARSELAMLASAMVEFAYTEVACARLESAIALLTEALDWAQRSDNAHALLSAAGELSWIRAFQGEQVMSSEWWDLATAIRGRVAPGSIGRGVLALAEGIRRYDADDLAGSHEVLTGGADIRRSGEEAALLCAASRAIVASIAGIGAPEKQRADLDLAVALAPAGALRLPINVGLLTIAQSLIDAYADRPEQALLRLEGRARVDGDRGFDDYATIWHARLSFVIGDVGTAVRESEAVLAVPRLGARTRVEALALRAELRAAIGARGAAQEAGAEAIDLAERAGMKLLIRRLRSGSPDLTLGLTRHPGYERLTGQELRVLRGILDGRTLADIAAELVLSVNTIKSHRRSLSRKLGASSREQLREEAYRRGLMRA